VTCRKKIDCLIIGDCFHDITVKFSAYEKAVKVGGAVQIANLRVLPGGTGNVAVTITRLGGVAAFCGVVGDDPLGRAYRNDLKENSILPLVFMKRDFPTGVLLALVSSNGERSFLVSRGANDCLEIEHVNTAFERFDPNIVFISGYSFTKKSMKMVLLHSIELAEKNNSKILFDCTPFNLMQINRDLFMHIISKSYCTCLNYQEACSLVDACGTRNIVRNLRKNTGFFALKLGSRGCILVTPQGVNKIGGKKVPIKDTNGAGDCFAGAIAYGISRNLSKLKMGKLAVRMGTLKVQYHGPRLPIDDLFSESALVHD
jgi:sugar/nucleoside kinase (ribokinase family)